MVVDGLTHIAVVRQHVYPSPLGHNVPHAIWKRARVGDILIFQVEYGDLGYIRFARVGRARDVIPDCGRGRLGRGREWGRDDDDVVSVGVDGGFVAFVSVTRAPSVRAAKINRFFPRDDHVSGFPIHPCAPESGPDLVDHCGLSAASFSGNLVRKDVACGDDEEVSVGGVVGGLPESEASDGFISCYRS